MANIVLSTIENELEEEVLSLPKSRVEEIFFDRVTIGKEEGLRLVEAFTKEGNFTAREKIESDFGKIFFFHKSNEKEEIFSQLKIGSKVTFETTKTEKGLLAFNIEVIKD